MVRKRIFTASLPPLKMLQAEYAPPHEVRLSSWFFEKWVVLAMEHQAMAFGQAMAFRHPGNPSSTDGGQMMGIDPLMLAEAMGLIILYHPFLDMSGQGDCS